MINNNKPIKAILLFGGILLMLSGCEGAKEKMGLTHQAPDEFAVVTRAPLVMPPDYTLRPPQPGALRPQEQSPSAQAREIIFGGEALRANEPDAAELSLLERTGAVNADPSIRQIVDQEAAALETRERPVAERLFGWGRDRPPPATVVDAAAEAERLRRAKEADKPITEGDSPSIEE